MSSLDKQFGTTNIIPYPHVRSQLCYVSEVWSPNTVKLSKRVESVQRRATTWILNCNHGELTYQQRLICLDLLPLCYERETSDLVFFFNFMASQIWTSIPLSPFPTMVGPDFVKIFRSPLKFPSVNQTHSKHPTSTELLTNGTISVKFNILLPSVLSLRLKGTLGTGVKLER